MDSDGQLKNHFLYHDASSSLAASPHTCQIACLQLRVTRLMQLHSHMCQVVSSGARLPACASCVFLDLKSSAPIHEDKAIKQSRALRHDKRWLSRICEWIRERSTWMTAWVQEQWMNQNQEDSSFTASSNVWENNNSRESEITSN